MARNIEELKKQYNSVSHGMSLRGGGPGRGRGPGGKGKPKNISKTVSRILSYVGKYKLRLVFVFLSMFMTTICSLMGGFLSAPILNRLTVWLGLPLGEDMKLSQFEILADDLISKITAAVTGTEVDDVHISSYVLCTIVLLAIVYGISAFGSYLQGRLMLTVSQSSIQKIREDLFKALQRLPVRFFDSHPTGEIMSRFTNDVDNIDVMLNNSLTSIVGGVITLVGTFTIMLITNGWLTLITVVFIPILMFAAATIAKNSSKYFGAQQSALVL